MAVQAGRVVTIKAGDAAVAMTAEACTDSGDHTIYQITAAAKRAIDPATATVVYVDAVEQISTTYAINHAHGLITFGTPLGAEAVTISGKYLPLLTAAHGKSGKITYPTGEMVDVTQAGDTAPRALEIGKVCEIEVTHFAADTEYEAGVSASIEYLLSETKPLFLEVDLAPGLAGHLLRGWFQAVARSKDHPVDGARTSSVTFRGVVQTTIGRPTTDQALFSVR